WPFSSVMLILMFMGLLLFTARVLATLASSAVGPGLLWGPEKGNQRGDAPSLSGRAYSLNPGGFPYWKSPGGMLSLTWVPAECGERAMFALTASLNAYW